jgi:argininosuccinate lyase
MFSTSQVSHKPLWYKPNADALGSHTLLQAFNASIGYDQRLLPWDIQGCLAHVAMLQEVGLLTQQEYEQLTLGLETLAMQYQAGELNLEASGCEDVHSFIEAFLAESMGEVAKKLHTGRSRNDQVCLALRLYLRDTLARLIDKLTAYQKTLQNLGEAHTSTWMPGYTHLQRAMPVTMGNHFMAYHAMAGRDIVRLQHAMAHCNVSPLGAGALAGSSLPLNRHFVATSLGMTGVLENTLDAVGSRDFVLEVLSVLSIAMVHLSRFAEELILWSSQEFQFIQLPLALCTGSSMMPQKKNPDLPELVRGKTGRVFGSLIGLLTVMKALPLAYNKDMQEDKEGLFDALDTFSLCVEAMQACASGLEVNQARLQEVMQHPQGYLNATWLAEYFVQQGMPFREAYRVVGQAVALSESKGGCGLEALTLTDYQALYPEATPALFEALTAHHMVTT